MWKKFFFELARLLLAALAGVGGASAAGCSIIGHADNVYETPNFERVSK